jgi:hypothetical protein
MGIKRNKDKEYELFLHQKIRYSKAVLTINKKIT